MARKKVAPEVRKTRLTRNSRDWWDPFFEAFTKTFSVATACRAVGITRANVELRRKKNKEFAKRFEEAREDVRDGIREEMLKYIQEHDQNGVKALIAAARLWLPEGREAAQVKHQVDGNVEHKHLYGVTPEMLTVIAHAAEKYSICQVPELEDKDEEDS